MTTLAPAWVNNRTHASPRPDAPPVTSTPLSLSSIVVSFLLHVLRFRGDGMGEERGDPRVPTRLHTTPAPTGCTWYTQEEQGDRKGPHPSPHRPAPYGMYMAYSEYVTHCTTARALRCRQAANATA